MTDCSNCDKTFVEVFPGKCSVCGTPTERATAPRETRDSDAARGQADAIVEFPWGDHPVEDGDRLYLGRSPEYSEFADRLADYECVSREHAVLVFAGGAFYLQDADSTNGTSIDGEGADELSRVVPIDATIVLAGSVEITLRRV